LDAVQSYQSALDLYDGEYLNNLYYDWLLPERMRLNEAYVSGLGELARLTARLGDLETAIMLARKALAINPFLENTHCDIMRYLHQLGDRQGMVRQYQSLCDLLHDELDADPHPRTRQLFVTLNTSYPDRPDDPNSP
jgi:DNA-binding SARP family transcriptional activator